FFYFSARRRRRAVTLVLPPLRLLRRRFPRGGEVYRRTRRARRGAVHRDRLAGPPLRRALPPPRSAADAGAARARLPLRPRLPCDLPGLPPLLPQPARSREPVASHALARGEDPPPGTRVRLPARAARIACSTDGPAFPS